MMRNCLFAMLVACGAAQADPTVFETPDAAVEALVAALENEYRQAVLAIFGPEYEDILSTGDPGEDREIWGSFVADVRARVFLKREGSDLMVLEVGRELWPFPAPIARGETGWSFDGEAAREEVLMRRIGQNELAAIDVLSRAKAIQYAFRQTDHDGDGVMEFASSILSTHGARDGLYWPDQAGTPRSPFDEEIARASLTGYNIDGTDQDPEPYEGYYFRILHGQGDLAPGGAYSYLINGNMVGGYAVLAVPAAYEDTGIMSFLVGENGVLYEFDPARSRRGGASG